MPDKILLSGTHFFAHHGVSDAEQKVGGRYVVDVELAYDLSRAGTTDHLDDTISYAEVYDVVRAIVEGKSYRLMETLAENIAQTLLKQFPAESVLVRVKKQPPPIPAVIDFAGVEIFRERKG